MTSMGAPALLKSIGQKNKRLIGRKRIILPYFVLLTKTCAIMCRLRYCGILFLLPLLLTSCRNYLNQYPERPEQVKEEIVSLAGVARIMSELPLDKGHISEVFDAVNNSSGNGYDEEYMMSDLFSRPGAGVGDKLGKVRASSYNTPLRDLFQDYFDNYCVTTRSPKSSLDYISELADSDMQIYWPYSEQWDGQTPPIITFDPGFGADSNYGFKISYDADGQKLVDSVYVDEAVAMSHPVWVINRNDDSAYTPFELMDITTGAPVRNKAPVTPNASSKYLMIKSFEMLRHYDSWFGGASEFFIKCGGLDGFYATTQEEINMYRPAITDFMVVIKRSQLKQDVPIETIILTDFTDQIDKLVFMVIEDDGGEVTSWKCSATVKYNSKSFGFDVEIPYRDKDDIVWRGQLSSNFFRESNVVTGRFGDVRITFETR